METCEGGSTEARRRVFSQTWSNNMKSAGKAEVVDWKELTQEQRDLFRGGGGGGGGGGEKDEQRAPGFTRVSFVPDLKRMGNMAMLEEDSLRGEHNQEKGNI